jgi:hypothetical protein
MSEMRLLPFKWVAIFSLIWLLTALACNAPIRGQATVAPPPTASSGDVTAVPPTDSATAPTPVTLAATVAPATVAIIVSPPTAVAETATALPTFTPIAAPTLAPTLSATATSPPAPAATATPRPTATPAIQGPLNFTYDLQWRFNPNNYSQVIGTITIAATGGNGIYSYYHDDVLQPGFRFEFNWGACQNRPGSLRVDSAGQSVRQNYFSVPPCATPAP